MSRTDKRKRDAANTTARRRRRLASPLIAYLIVIVFSQIFGVAGYVLGALRAPTYSVSAQVQAQPTPTLENSDPAPTTIDENNIFMQAQVQIMAGVTGKLPGGAAAAVSQVGLSNVLQVSATASAKSDAVAAANLVVQRYVALRGRQVADYNSHAQTQIDQQLGQDAAALKAIDSTSPQAGAERSALEGDYSRLLTLKRQLSLSATTSSATVVIGQATLDDVAQVSNNARNAVLAAIVGALIGIAVVLALRKSAAAESAESAQTDADRS